MLLCWVMKLINLRFLLTRSKNIICKIVKTSWTTFVVQLVLFVIFFVVHTPIISQTFERDTSYTVSSAFAKSIKKFPGIQIAKSQHVSRVIKRTDIKYKSLGYRELTLDIYSKELLNPLPMVVMVHGGGWLSGDKVNLEAMGFELAEKGYVVASVEYRLSPEAQYPAGVRDVKDAISWLRDHATDFQIDTSRVAILGTSAGGQVATLAGYSHGLTYLDGELAYVKSSSKVQAVINLDGVLAFRHPISQEGKVAGLWLGGTYEEAKANWEQASPINHVSADDPPTLFIHSQYPRFHAGREEVIQQLTSYGIYSEVKGFDDCPHTFWLFDPWFEPTTQYIVSFLERVFGKE